MLTSVALKTSKCLMYNSVFLNVRLPQREMHYIQPYGTSLYLKVHTFCTHRHFIKYSSKHVASSVKSTIICIVYYNKMSCNKICFKLLFPQFMRKRHQIWQDDRLSWSERIQKFWLPWQPLLVGKPWFLWLPKSIYQ